jgi:HJR/Mrr/RecB family endonuclease
VLSPRVRPSRNLVAGLLWQHTDVRTIDHLLERMATWLVTSLSGPMVIVIALLFYPGFGLALPLVLHWPTPGLIECNVLGVTLAGVVSLGWLTAQVEAAKRRHLVEWTTDLRLLTAEEFEWLAGETFRREGWTVEETGRQDAPDGNIDLKLTRDGRRMIVQCKRWTSQAVGVDEVRELAGTLLREGLRGSSGILVTLSDYTPSARAEARTIGIELVNGRGLFSRIEKVRRPVRCEICHQPMLLSRSARGWWFRCVTSGCGGKLDLADEPGRAVELLTSLPHGSG